MARRRYEIDEAKIARFQKEGRGEGEGAGYKPWLTIQDVPSTGRRTRLHGSRFGRGHHLLSDIETSVFFLLHWSDAVTDIREQFPLDRERTRVIASALGIRHPRESHTRTDLVMTVDLVATIDGKTLPVSCKPVSELADRRTLEKLEIERRACVEKWGAWVLMTERDYSKPFVHNLAWIHEYRSLEHLEAPHPSYWQDGCQHLLRILGKRSSHSLAAAFAMTESQHGMEKGDALSIYRHLLAVKAISMDLSGPFCDSTPVSSITLKGPQRAVRSVA
jgi:hypothetical protein